MDNLTEATPPVIDTELARLHGEAAKATHRITATFDTLHRLAGHKATYSRRRETFRESDESAETWVRSALDVLASWDRSTAVRALDTLDTHRALLAEARAAMVPLDAEWSRRRWSRFFLVTGGHVHASTGCHTIRMTTDVGWLPALSGLTEKDAVDAHGTILCTHCFPSAPVEWTVGKPADPNTCPGSGKGYAEGSLTRGYSRYGKCQVCETTQSVTSIGAIRKHKTPKK